MVKIRFLLIFFCFFAAVIGKSPSGKNPKPRMPVSGSKTAPAPSGGGGGGGSPGMSGSRISGDDESETTLCNIIFAHYNKELVPKWPTVVKLDLVLLKVKSTIEKEGIFESVITMLLTWEDQRVTWKPSECNNLSVLTFETDKIWLPDVAMTNSADHLYAITKDTRFVVRSFNNGTMRFIPTGTAKTWCALNLHSFPFDVQTCSFEFESWALDSTAMTFDESSMAIVDDSFSSPEWQLCDSHSLVYDHYYNFTGETFTRVRFDFVVRRKSTFYVVNIIFLCAILSLIQLLVFIIPSTDTTLDRLAFGTTNLLTFVVFQSIVTAEMPKSSDAVTALSKYIIGLIMTSAIGILQSVMVERLLRATRKPPPRWAVRLSALMPLFWGAQMPSGINRLIAEGAMGVVSRKKTQKALKQGFPSFKKLARKKSSPENGDGIDVDMENNADQGVAIICEPMSPVFFRERHPPYSPNKPQGNHLGLNFLDLAAEVYKNNTRLTARHHHRTLAEENDRHFLQVPQPPPKITFQSDTSDDDDDHQQPTRLSSESESAGQDEKAAREAMIRAHIMNGIKWGKLITKFDHLTFILSLIISVGSPIALFASAVFADVELCYQQQ